MSALTDTEGLSKKVFFVWFYILFYVIMKTQGAAIL